MVPLRPSLSLCLDLHESPLEPLELRSVGTNGYVSTWGAIMSACPPRG